MKEAKREEEEGDRDREKESPQRGEWGHARATRT